MDFWGHQLKTIKNNYSEYLENNLYKPCRCLLSVPDLCLRRISLSLKCDKPDSSGKCVRFAIFSSQKCAKFENIRQENVFLFA